jgi:hypothetical protein
MINNNMVTQIETLEEIEKSGDSRGELNRWVKEIENASNAEKKWRQEADEYFAIYKDEAEGQAFAQERYNIFWSNTQTLRPLVFSRLPNSNITRRFLSDDGIARIMSEMMERSVNYFLEDTNAEPVFNAVRDDFLIAGRGVARVILDPAEIMTTKEKDEHGIEREVENIDNEAKTVRIEYVNWHDFRMSPAKAWKDVRWIAFRHQMTRAQLIEQFGKLGEQVNLDNNILSYLEKGDNNLENEDLLKVAEVWEIWDKDSHNVIFISSGYDKGVLSKEDDLYNLKNFFPTPKPLGSNSSPDSLLPIPLYRMYKSQAAELNAIDARIKGLIQQIKFTGVYQSVVDDTDITSLLNGEDGVFTPMSFVGGSSDIRQNIFTKPIGEIAVVIAQLNEQKARILQNIRDITGLSDIVRGTTVASETATAQKLKGDFAISRIQPLQHEMEVYVRDLIRLESELIVENFSVEELAEITGLKIIDFKKIEKKAMNNAKKLLEEALSLLNPEDPEIEQKKEQIIQQAQQGVTATLKPVGKALEGYAVTTEEAEQLQELMTSDLSRNYAVDVETDSTVRMDQQQEKSNRLEYVSAITNFSSSFFPLVQAGIVSPETFNQFLGFISKPFKVGRNLEESLLAPVEPEPQGPSIDEQNMAAESQRRDMELQLKAKEVDIKQQEVDIKKAEVLQKGAQFDDNLEFQDANKAADRQTRTSDAIIQDSTRIAVEAVRNSNLLGV